MKSEGLIIVAFLAAVLLSGCTAKNASQFLGSIGASAASIKDDTKVIRQHADGEGRSRADSIDHKADAIIADNTKAQKAVTAQARDNQKLREDLAALNNSISVKIGRFLSRAFWLLVIGLPLACIGVGILKEMSGPWGAIGKGILGFVKWLNPGKWFAHAGGFIARKAGANGTGSE